MSDVLDATPVQTDEASERSRRLSEAALAGAPHAMGFQVLKKLGEGAYGAVWLARENKTGKQVAIKFYTHHRGLDWSLLNREVEKLALLYTSRNIVRLIDVGWQHDPPYYVMEYLDNGSLSAMLQDGPLPVDEAIRLVRSICQALVHAHGRGVLHCDLKPANVLLDSDFEPRLCDFGQSRLSNEQNPALGTLFYMAPEQADLAAVPDARWDVYALGALLYHLLVGEPPYRTPEAEARLHAASSLEERLKIYQQLVRESPRPTAHNHVRGVDRRLAEIVERCLQLNPDRRYANAQAVLDVLYIRDRQRRLRPLVALGGIGPGLLLVAMFFLAKNLMDSAVDTAEENLTERAFEAQVMSANIVSRSVERELQDRMDELIEVAADTQLRAAIAASADRGWSDRENFQQILESTKSTVDRRRKEQGRELDVSWLLVDAQGFQRWRDPLEPATIDHNFSHRDYFHGRDKEYKPGHVPEGIQAIMEPHLSLAFQSAVTKTNIIAMTVPVWDAKQENVIAVLGRTTNLGQLLSQYEVSIRGRDGIHRTIAIVDRRNWRLLDHSGLKNSKVRAELTSDEFRALHLDESIIPRIEEAEEQAKSGGSSTPNTDREVRISLEDYQDPLAIISPDDFGGDWLASFCPVGLTRWTAIVQERKATVLQPVYEMQQQLVFYAWLGLSVGGLVVAGLWYFVLRAINERGIRQWTRSPRPASDRLTSHTDAK